MTALGAAVKAICPSALNRVKASQSPPPGPRTPASIVWPCALEYAHAVVPSPRVSLVFAAHSFGPPDPPGPAT